VSEEATLGTCDFDPEKVAALQTENADLWKELGEAQRQVEAWRARVEARENRAVSAMREVARLRAELAERSSPRPSRPHTPSSSALNSWQI